MKGTLPRWVGPRGRAQGRELLIYIPLVVTPGPSRGWRRRGWLQDGDHSSQCLLQQLTAVYAPAAWLHLVFFIHSNNVFMR